MILDAPRAALGSETNTNLDVHSRSGRGLQISNRSPSADRCADAKLFPKAFEAAGHRSATASTELQLCTSVHCGTAGELQCTGQRKHSQLRCCSCNPMKRVRIRIRIRSRGVAACLEAHHPTYKLDLTATLRAPSTYAACIPRSSE